MKNTRMTIVFYKVKMNEIYFNQQMIGGFGDAYDCSLTEYSDIKVHIQYLTTGVHYYGGKGYRKGMSITCVLVFHILMQPIFLFKYDTL